ncbi:MAG: S9 family peptidase [Bryobacterales bacterium]|nr:S9 family peptidase [Bryobacterales bacterium]MBV9401278.1 S9 family peptidase [Bryobacterales bacterium]
MSATLTSPPGQGALKPPVAKIAPKYMTVHGDVRADNYFWLRDRSDPDTIPYLEAENSYTQAVMKDTEELQSRLYAEMLGRIKQTDLSVPVKRDDYFYYSRTEEGKQYSIYCRKQGSLDAPEEVLLDANAMAEGQKYFRIGVYAASPNHALLAYSTDLTGDEVFTLRVKNLATGDLLTDEIQGTSYSLEWAGDNATLFYTVLDEAKRPFKVFRHALGEASDTLVYHEPDRRFEVDLSKTSSRAFILLTSRSPLTTEIQYLPSDDPRGSFRVVLPRAHEIEYDLTHHGDSFFIRTNDGAKTFRLVKAPVSTPQKANWKEVISARQSATIEDVTAFEDYLVVEERELGLPRIRIENLVSGLTHYVGFPEPVYSVGLTGNAEFSVKKLRFSYTSLTTPTSIFDYDMETRARELKKQQEVLGGYDSSLYQSERIYATAPDGVKVPVSLVYKKGVQKDGSAPMLLYGYGAYGLSMEPVFSSDRLSLVDRGVIFAIAHIRGGGDLGKPWHEDGRLLNKKNTFTDFIACAEHLIANRYTQAGRLAIEGRSAGGLLIAAVLNIRPELFGVALAGVPFVDAVNTMLDASLPLTVGEYEEWGNPEDRIFYDYIKSYAPYENVAPKAYPTLLITAGLNDPRVSYWEPAKWAAKLRAVKTDTNPLLLKTNMGSGHFGASGRYEYLKETAFNYAFLLKALSIEKL